MVPGAYRYAADSQTRRLGVFRVLIRGKAIGLRVALVAFAMDSVIFAALFLVVFWGRGVFALTPNPSPAAWERKGAKAQARPPAR